MSHKNLVGIRALCVRSGNICASFASSGMLSMSRSHVCVDLSLDTSGMLVEIGLTAGCNFLPVFL